MTILTVIIALTMSGGAFWLFISALRYATGHQSVRPRQASSGTSDMGLLPDSNSLGDMSVSSSHHSGFDSGATQDCPVSDSGGGDGGVGSDCSSGDSGSSGGSD